MNSEPHPPYPGHHDKQGGADTNKLRAAVLGANDGTVSVASIVVGVAGASNSTGQIITAGIAGLVAGAFSMGVGEYVSVSSQRDTEKMLLHNETQLLEKYPAEELDELTELYKAKGLSNETARKVAEELTDNDPHAAHFDAELGIDPNALINPWHAAFASTGAFTAGALIPLIAIIVFPKDIRIAATFVAVIIALVLTGLMSANASGASKVHSARRVVIGGVIAMTVTYLIGKLVGISSL